MTEPLQPPPGRGEAMEPLIRGRPLTMARICKAIANLGEKGGSKASDINKILSQQNGLRTSSAELKRMLIRAVKAGKVHQTPRTNRFILRVPQSASRGGSRGDSRYGRRRRRRRKGGRKGRKKGGRRRSRRRRRRGRGKGKGKGRKGRRRRRRRRRGRRGRGKR